MAALGDVRRFSHTLGVLYLAKQLPRKHFSPNEWEAFELACLLHDIGTPAFAHLLESHLCHPSGGWDHEEMAPRIIHGHAVAANRVQQIWRGRPLKFLKIAKAHTLPVQLVDEILAKSHPLSRLLFGTLDVDNLDNVARMTWALGMPSAIAAVVAIARNLSVDADGHLVLSRDHHEDVRHWLRSRSNAYRLMNFDSVAIALQAALSDSIGRAIRSNAIDTDDGTLTDEALIELLRGCEGVKDDFVKDFCDMPMERAFAIRVQGSLDSIGFSSREQAKQAIEQVLTARFRGRRTLGYTLRDRSTFERRVEFRDEGGQPWEEGRDSDSVIFYGFVRSTGPLQETTCRSALDDLVQSLGISERAAIESYVGNTSSSADLQRSFAFAAGER